MRRIHLVAVVTLILGTLILVLPFARNAASFSAPMLQTPGGTTTLRRIQVNARTIAALPRTQKYVVDLTQRGVKYEFNPQAGQIDFGRVSFRTARGEVTIGSFLETIFPKDKLARFKYTSQSFIVGTRPPGTLQNPPTNTSNFDCSPNYCTCEETAGIPYNDCFNLADSLLCGGNWGCVWLDNKRLLCACERRAS